MEDTQAENMSVVRRERGGWNEEPGAGTEEAFREKSREHLVMCLVLWTFSLSFHLWA